MVDNTTYVTGGVIMAKSGLSSAIKIVKAIDRAGKQASKNAERRRKEEIREQNRLFKAQERAIREQERQNKLYEKHLSASKKSEFKEALEDSKLEYEGRVSEREALRLNFIREVLK